MNVQRPFGIALAIAVVLGIDWPRCWASPLTVTGPNRTSEGGMSVESAFQTTS